LNEFGEELLSSVGCVHVEAEGIRMFSSIHGDYYTIMGMPLLPLLNFLRCQNLIAR